MKIITICNNKENIQNLLQTKADIIAVGCKGFSDKTQTKLNKKEIKDLLDSSKKACKEIYLYLDAFIYDSMIPGLEELLVYLDSIKIDGIIFNDLGINQICYEKKLKLNLVYDPKALITNYEQFPFFKKNDINAVVLANELKEFEVVECCKNKKDMKLAKQVAGYVFIMESR
ncbi:MAG: U32 family peptidase [Clostridia bacterium]|nr:U32 family peptidase [Clostridia bacterium]